MKKVLVLIILIVVIGAIFYFWQKTKMVYVPIDVENYSWTVNFQFSDTDNNILELNNQKSLTLSEITETIAQNQGWDYQYKDYGDMGILVTKIKDKENGQDQKYWQYFVAGEQPQISVDKYMPNDKSYIEWKFQESEL